MTDRPIQAEAAPRVPPFAVPTWLRPVTVPSGEHGLAGGWARFTDMDVVQRHADGGYSICRMGLDDLLQAADDRNLASAAMDRLLAPRDPFAGLSMTAPRLMGILNVTPDSFSDGGRHNAPARAIAAARAMQDAGAAIIDIGGESTRPGAAPVTRNQELARVLPVLAGLRDSGAVLSIDTRHAEVMRRAVAGGAGIINDFAFVFVIGIVTGTFSSIFIASPIFYFWHKGDRKHVEEGEILPKYEWQTSTSK